MIDQELLNKMMRHPFEVKSNNSQHWNVCPKCKENYCGDGVCLCVECQIESKEQK